MSKPTPANTALIIPTYNAGPFANRMAKAVRTQTFQPSRWLVVDSASRDDTVAIFREAGAEIVMITPAQFDHGGTRQMAAELCADKEYLLYLTHDAVPANAEAFSRLLAGFEDGDRVGLCYGRQLPRPEAGPVEAQARIFNYPPQSSVVTPQDAPMLGVRATFCSDSFSAYRASALADVGGFPDGTIFGEDAIVAGRMLLRGWSKSYRGDAEVVHSHDYTIAEEAKRYFDVGVLHARESWIRSSFGSAEGAGVTFLKSQMKYLAERSPLRISGAILRAAVKYVTYRLGLEEARLPLGLKRRLSMNRRFWKG